MEKLETLYSDTEKRIFHETGGKIFVGGEAIPEQMLTALKGQAKFLKTSNLYDILDKTVMNEAYYLALRESKDWDNVQFAKSLAYCSKIYKKIIDKLAE